MMQLSKRLLELRKKKGVTLKTASRSIGCSFQHLSKLENDKAFRPKIELLERMSAYYGVSPDTIIIEAGKVPQDVYWKIVNNPQLLTIIRNYEV